MKLIEKTWYYKNGFDKEPIPVLLLSIYYFSNFNVCHYREVLDGGSLGPIVECIEKSSGQDPFGLNEFAKFPEIKTRYCRGCGIVEDEICWQEDYLPRLDVIHDEGPEPEDE